MSPKLLKVEKRLYREVMVEIRKQVGAMPPELQRYENEYRQYMTQELITPSAPEGAMQAVCDVEVVYCGDYHTYSQAQATLVRVLQTLVHAGREVVLGVECILSDYQTNLDFYMAGEISESKFLRLIDWKMTWGFSWENYRPIFEWARENSLSMVGLNGPGMALRGSLKRRDLHASKIIAATMQSHPKRIMVVQQGDLHLAPSHLPNKVKLALGRNVRQVILLQNYDQPYWQYGYAADAVRVNHEVFVLFHRPLFRKPLSYLEWLTEGDYGFEQFRDELEGQYLSALG